jgi:hypothetical protein
MMTAEPAVIARLRERSVQEPVIPTVAQLKTIVDAVFANESLDHTARLAGLDVERTLELISQLGEWLRQSGKLKLPNLVSDEEYRAAQATSKSKADRAKSEMLVLFNLPAQPKAANGWVSPAPPGFVGPSVRDVAKPLAALLVTHPDTSVLERWVARTYTASLPLLTFPVVAAVWRFATLDILDKIEDVSPSPRFAKVAVEAWDLLEFARQDAMTAIELLCGPLLEASRRPLDDDGRAQLAEAVGGACRRAQWLSEHELLRVSRTADLAVTDPPAQELLTSQLVYLRQRAKAHPGTFRVEQVARIREGQLMRICQMAGIPTDPPDPKLAVQVRSRLKSLGLDKDADQLVPNALNAAQAGRLDGFWKAIEARVAGQPEWIEQLLSLSR